MSNNLSAYFSAPADTQPEDVGNANVEAPVRYDDEEMGPSISMAKEAETDDEFEKSTFNLKRTRSMGLLDEYIDPTKKLLEGEKNTNKTNKGKSNRYKNKTNSTNNSYSSDSDSYSSSNSDPASDSVSDSDSDSDSDSNSSYSGKDGSDSDDQQIKSNSVSPPSANNDNLLIPQDDIDVVEEPERHVDYLSHHWEESEISNSWKYIILKKKKKGIDLVNASRLENASWRTWAKARNHLKTVSPEAVNWSKDSDVTWLYGPIMRDNQNIDENNDEDDNFNVARGYGSDNEASMMLPSIKCAKNTNKKSNKTGKKLPKPILKKRTVSEIIEENAQWKLNEARKHYNDVRHAATTLDPSVNDHDDYDILAAKVNAQYFQKPQKSGSETSSSSSGASETVTQSTNELSSASDTYKIAINGDAYNNNSESQETITTPLKTNVMKNEEGTLSSILTNSSNLLKNNEIAKEKPKRHIHFNDRVQQCMALKYASDNNVESESADESDNDMYSYNSEDDDTDDTSNLSKTKSKNGSRSSFLLNSTEDSDTSSDGDSEYDSNDNENGDGLFINARFARRSDSLAQSSMPTDTSSIISNVRSLTGRVRPIIKLLPATTLNYGSDEESEGSDYSNYGNAVSHNVNTQRGYDYIYDYNSVYTGDTSNFLPIDSCDIVDVPEGINLQTSIADSNTANYSFDNTGKKIQVPKPSAPKVTYADDGSNNILDTATENSNLYSSDDQYSMSSNTDDEFIEDSYYHSSGDEEEGERGSDGVGSIPSNDEYNKPDLKRTVSLGKSTDSLRNLSQTFNDSTSKLTCHSSITGQELNTNVAKKNLISGEPSTSSFSKRNSNRSFIFNSDSEEDDSEDSRDGNFHQDLVSSPVLTADNGIPQNNKHKGHKLMPPKRTSSSSLLGARSDSDSKTTAS